MAPEDNAVDLFIRYSKGYICAVLQFYSVTREVMEIYYSGEDERQFKEHNAELEEEE